MADLLSSIEGPASSSYGTDLYDFGYAGANLPPAQAATTASQLESGGSGFNWNAALSDITKVYMATQSNNATPMQVPTGYRVNEQGQLYAVDPTYSGGVRTLGGVGSAIGGIPTGWIIIGVIGFLMYSAADSKA